MESRSLREVLKERQCAPRVNLGHGKKPRQEADR